METIIEQQRRYHEELERLELAAANELAQRGKSLKDQINTDHRVHALLERIEGRSKDLLALYEDADGLRKSEIAALSMGGEFSEFYDRLKALKDYHRRNPNEIAEPMEMEFLVRDSADGDAKESGEEEVMMIEFTDEEGFGRYLDLHEHFNTYLNLRGVERVDYITFLQTFDRFFDIPREKKTQEYQSYVRGLRDYLYDYHTRLNPLFDIDGELSRAREAFDRQWSVGRFMGWEGIDVGEQNGVGNGAGASLFCVACGKDFAKQTVFDAHLKGQKHVKAAQRMAAEGRSASQADAAELKRAHDAEKLAKLREVALLEAEVYALVELLSEQRQATRSEVERKQARTADEILAEHDEAEVVVDDEDDDADKPIYNPKNVPLGWDGKPIPYWLYKLHGLNISYDCEICGNQSYRGPKAFQRHFQEWRHAHGMRQLGIPNTRHFLNVTQIEDARALWERIKGMKKVEMFKADVEEEYEDSQGNVVNKKIFEDLRRQGLL
eukprot:Opistho-1_new@28669